MQQSLAVQAKAGLIFGVIAVRLLIQGHKESGTLNGVQRSLVLAGAEEGLACLCPLRSGGIRAG